MRLLNFFPQAALMISWECKEGLSLMNPSMFPILSFSQTLRIFGRRRFSTFFFAIVSAEF